MPSACLPPDEDDRLAALAALKVMDTGPDPRFESFVRLAAELFSTPIALVSLVDESRQWFKAAHGTAMQQTARNVAFCAHAILQPDRVTVVEDAGLDPRFADNPLVVSDPKIRFYAGACVRAAAGQPLGTLCLLDTRPRGFDEAQCRRLQALAECVSGMLQLHGTADDLRRAATHDSLTGLANRALFDQRLDIAMTDAQLGRPCALMLLDLDRFKPINDQLGHMAGDELLRRVADRLRAVVRAGDLVARFGGDEFAILMSDPGDDGATGALVRRILGAFTEAFVLEGERVWAQTSIGVAHCPLDAQDAGGLLRAADQALYQAKRAGSGRAVLAGDRRIMQQAPATPAQDLEADFRAALDSDALSMHWQPTVDARTGAVVGWEALTRWRRPGHGDVEPAIFIPFAEASELIARLDSWMLERACRQASSWPADLPVSVNLSAYWLGAGDAASLVRTCLARSRLPASRLCVEISERSLATVGDTARAQMEALRALGVRMILDDFGCGFASLGNLRELPFDGLKLDRAFVASLKTVRGSKVAQAVLGLGHSLGMTVCAGGVETSDQLEQLRRAGFDLVQGFLLGPPQETPDFSRTRLAGTIFSRGTVAGQAGTLAGNAGAAARAMMPVVDWPANSSARTTRPPAASTSSAPTTLSTV